MHSRTLWNYSICEYSLKAWQRVLQIVLFKLFVSPKWVMGDRPISDGPPHGQRHHFLISLDHLEEISSVTFHPKSVTSFPQNELSTISIYETHLWQNSNPKLFIFFQTKWQFIKDNIPHGHYHNYYCFVCPNLWEVEHINRVYGEKELNN